MLAVLLNKLIQVIIRLQSKPLCLYVQSSYTIKFCFHHVYLFVFGHSYNLPFRQIFPCFSQYIFLRPRNFFNSCYRKYILTCTVYHDYIMADCNASHYAANVLQDCLVSMSTCGSMSSPDLTTCRFFKLRLSKEHGYSILPCINFSRQVDMGIFYWLTLDFYRPAGIARTIVRVARRLH